MYLCVWYIANEKNALRKRRRDGDLQARQNALTAFVERRIRVFIAIAC